MTCLWSPPCNHRAGKAAHILIPEPELLLPCSVLEALGGEEECGDRAEVPVSPSEALLLLIKSSFFLKKIVHHFMWCSQQPASVRARRSLTG